jgi:electron transfer flavoprotein beta subunit
MLDLPLITYVGKVESIVSGYLRAERLVEGGREFVSVKPPVLMTVVKEIAVPRLPTLRGILRAKEAVVNLWGPDDISAEPDLIGLKGSPTRVVRVHHPKVTRKGEQIIVKDQSNLDQAVERIMDFMKLRNIL